MLEEILTFYVFIYNVGSKRKIKPLSISTAIESVDSDPFKEIEVHTNTVLLTYVHIILCF